MRKLVFSRRANDDLAGIASYIASDKPIAARNFVRKLRDRCKELGIRPWVGEECTEFRSRSYRKSVFRNYLIIYEVDNTAVRIVRVVHTARDWGNLFD